MQMTRGNRPVYVISIAASIAGCHPRTLRIYEEEGLVEPVRTDSNIRLYSDEDLQRVRIIRYLTQQRGVNLAGVKLLLQFRDAADLLRELADAIEEMDNGTAATTASGAAIRTTADTSAVGSARRGANNRLERGPTK
jgi:MerR family transcriptional regulator/heat shock protein HspR